MLRSLSIFLTLAWITYVGKDDRQNMQQWERAIDVSRLLKVKLGSRDRLRIPAKLVKSSFCVFCVLYSYCFGHE